MATISFTRDLDKVWAKDESTGGYTDYTGDANDPDGPDYMPFVVSPEVGDLAAFGGNYGLPAELEFIGGITGSGGTVVWQYWSVDGAFTNLENVSDGTNGLTQPGIVSYDIPKDFFHLDVGGTDDYYIFAVLLSPPSSQATYAQVRMNHLVLAPTTDGTGAIQYPDDSLRIDEEPLIVSALEGSFLEVFHLGVASTGGDNSKWILRNLMVHFRADEPPDSADATGNGLLDFKNSSLVLTREFANPGSRYNFPTGQNAPFGNGIKIVLSNALLRTYRFKQTGFLLRLARIHPDPALSDFTGLDVGEGVFLSATSSVSWVRATFPSDVTEVLPGFSIFTAYVSGIDPLHGVKWGGYFDCDFSSVPESGGDAVGQLGLLDNDWEVEIGQKPILFLINAITSPSLLNFTLFNEGFTPTPSVGDSFFAVSGKGFKVLILATDGTEESDNTKIDFLAFNVNKAQSTTDQLSDLERFLSDGNNNLQSYYEHGWIIEQSLVEVVRNSTTLADPGNIGYLLPNITAPILLNFYNYNLEVWDVTDGTILPIEIEISSFSSPMVLASPSTLIFPPSQQSMIDSGSAEQYRLGSSPILNIEQLLAAIRKDAAEQGRDQLLVYSPDPASNSIVVPSGVELQDNGGVLSASSSIIAGNFGNLTFSSAYDKIQNNIIISFNIGDGLHFMGDLTLNIVQDLTSVRVDNTLFLALDGSYNFDGCQIQTIEALGSVSPGGITVNLSNNPQMIINNSPAKITLIEQIDVLAPNIVDGSWIELFNITQGMVFRSEAVSGGGGYSTTIDRGTDYEIGDTIRLRVAAEEKELLEAQRTIDGDNVVFNEIQSDDVAQQELIGILGIASGEDLDQSQGGSLSILPYTGTPQLYANSPTNRLTIQEIYLHYKWSLLSAVGIANFFGAWQAIDLSNLSLEPGVDIVLFNQDQGTTLNIEGNMTVPVAGYNLQASGGGSLFINNLSVLSSNWTPQEKTQTQADIDKIKATGNAALGIAVAGLRNK